jgi:hypothetical protein
MTFMQAMYCPAMSRPLCRTSTLPLKAPPVRARLSIHRALLSAADLRPVGAVVVSSFAASAHSPLLWRQWHNTIAAKTPMTMLTSLYGEHAACLTVHNVL